MWERTVTISSAGKTFSFTGWKVGWVTGPADLVATVMAAKQWLTFSNAAPLQPAVAHALTQEAAFYDGLAKELAGQARPARRRACGRSTWRSTRPRRRTSSPPTSAAYGHADGMAFCLALPERAGVVAIPSQVFYDDQDEGRHQVRWAFCKDDRGRRGGRAPAAAGRPAGLT